MSPEPLDDDSVGMLTLYEISWTSEGVYLANCAVVRPAAEVLAMREEKDS